MLPRVPSLGFKMSRVPCDSQGLRRAQKNMQGFLTPKDLLELPSAPIAPRGYKYPQKLSETPKGDPGGPSN